jgi:putative spermidine/putrescine transport system ATP-binding protein/spermidine/putrescine transport system ATP-binding protein
MFEGRVEQRQGGGAIISVSQGLRLLVDELPASAADVMVSIRPEAITVERAGEDISAERPNGVAARIDQAIYRGFVSHYYLKTKSGEQIIAFEQNQSQRAGLRYAVGEEVIARWDSSSNHVIPRH